MKCHHLIGLCNNLMALSVINIMADNQMTCLVDNHNMKSGLLSSSLINHAIKENGLKTLISLKEEELEYGQMARGMMDTGNWDIRMVTEE